MPNQLSRISLFVVLGILMVLGVAGFLYMRTHNTSRFSTDRTAHVLPGGESSPIPTGNLVAERPTAKVSTLWLLAMMAALCVVTFLSYRR